MAIKKENDVVGGISHTVTGKNLIMFPYPLGHVGHAVHQGDNKVFVADLSKDAPKWVGIDLSLFHGGVDNPFKSDIIKPIHSPSKGVPQVTNFEAEGKIPITAYSIDELLGMYTNLPAKQQSFATGLCATLKKFLVMGKQPTDNQHYWFDLLYKKATIQKGLHPIPVVQATTEEVGSMASIFAMFKKAGEKLKSPAIEIYDEYGKDTFVLKLAGSKSKFPGHINVKSATNYSAVWYGRISPEGVFYHSNKVNVAAQAKVVEFLKKFASDPEGYAAKSGKLTGKCCFCKKKLTDAVSVSNGYGPICAKHYGLKIGYSYSGGFVANTFAQAVKDYVVSVDHAAIKKIDDLCNEVVELKPASIFGGLNENLQKYYKGMKVNPAQQVVQDKAVVEIETEIKKEKLKEEIIRSDDLLF